MRIIDWSDVTFEKAADYVGPVIVKISCISPGSVIHANPRYAAIFDMLEARAPLGWEHVQYDGTYAWHLLVTPQTREQVLDERARAGGWSSNAELEREIRESDSAEA